MGSVTLAATKVCTVCKLEKSVGEFYLEPRTGRPRGRCKSCHCSSSYESRKKRPDHKEREGTENRVTGLRRVGVTPDEYDRMWKAQGGVCAICGEPETQTRRGNLMYLAVDHCHQTGKVRGLLCGHCNTGLGKFRDDPDRLQRAILYLEP